VTDELDWQIKHRADGNVDIYLPASFEPVRHVLVKMPADANRDVLVKDVVRSIIMDHEKRELSRKIERETSELRARIHSLKAKLDAHETASPPLLAALFISFLAPAKTAQVQLGDLQEMFQKNVERCGEREARRMYWMQVAEAAWPLLWGWVKRIGLVTFLVDYVRSKFGF
jgi:hypothetical protein